MKVPEECSITNSIEISLISHHKKERSGTLGLRDDCSLVILKANIKRYVKPVER